MQCTNAPSALQVRAMRRFLAFVPVPDVQAVETLLQSVRVADTNRDGKISDAELATMPPAQREQWREVQKLIG